METFKNNREACELEAQTPHNANLEEQIREIYIADDNNPETEEILTQIAWQVGGISTLERQNLDSQDFHDISVWRLRELLRVSYELGKIHGEPKSVTPIFEMTKTKNKFLPSLGVPVLFPRWRKALRNGEGLGARQGQSRA